MGTNCAGRHECEPVFFPTSLDERWTCPECKREHVPFMLADNPVIPQRIKDKLLPGSLGWRTKVALQRWVREAKYENVTDHCDECEHCGRVTEHVWGQDDRT